MEIIIGGDYKSLSQIPGHFRPAIDSYFLDEWMRLFRHAPPAVVLKGIMIISDRLIKNRDVFIKRSGSAPLCARLCQNIVREAAARRFSCVLFDFSFTLPEVFLNEAVKTIGKKLELFLPETAHTGKNGMLSVVTIPLHEPPATFMEERHREIPLSRTFFRLGSRCTLYELPDIENRARPFERQKALELKKERGASQFYDRDLLMDYFVYTKGRNGLYLCAMDSLPGVLAFCSLARGAGAGGIFIGLSSLIALTGSGNAMTAAASFTPILAKA